MVDVIETYLYFVGIPVIAGIIIWLLSLMFPGIRYTLRMAKAREELLVEDSNGQSMDATKPQTKNPGT